MKKITTCPSCQRDVNDVDDVLEVKGVVYHEECAPGTGAPQESAPAPTPQIDKPAKPEKGGKMSSKDELLMKLVDLVGDLQAEVRELKQQRHAAPARVAKPKSEKGQPRPHVYYVIKGFPSEKRPPQCLRVFRALAQAAPEGGRMTEMDVWNALMDGQFPSTKANANVGAWNYSQTPFYIFKYYRADMIDAEYVQGPFDAI